MSRSVLRNEWRMLLWTAVALFFAVANADAGNPWRALLFGVLAGAHVGTLAVLVALGPEATS